MWLHIAAYCQVYLVGVDQATSRVVREIGEQLGGRVEPDAAPCYIMHTSEEDVRQLNW